MAQHLAGVVSACKHRGCIRNPNSEKEREMFPLHFAGNVTRQGDDRESRRVADFTTTILRAGTSNERTPCG